jgi:hypothetical protein
MGRCYEFGTVIVDGCDHAMRVADAGGACICPTCGAHCEGRYKGCVPILQHAGYVPSTAPSWAVEGTEPPVAQPESGWRSRAEESPGAVATVDGSGDSARRLADAIGSSLAEATHARQARDMERVTMGTRAELLEAVDGVRREIADHSKQLEDGQERLRHDLTGARASDLEILRTMVDGLTRLSHRMERIEEALGLPPDSPARRRRPRT